MWERKKTEFIRELETIVGKDRVITSKETILDYLSDETPPAVRPKPAKDVVLIRPCSTQEVSSILILANEWKIPVFPRGGGTGIGGGSIPTRNGVILSLERMNRVVEVDEENLMIVVEAGVTLERLGEKADEISLLFPPHPGDETAQVGGLVACNAGGSRAVRYGVMRNYVKGIEVVLPTGKILNLGGKLLKDVAGYSLMHLIIGSQGTLGVITKVILRLYPRFNETATLIVPFKDRRKALKTVPKILREGIIPLAIEYVPRDLMERSAKHLGKTWPVKKGRAFLLIIVAGDSKEDVYFDAERIDKVARKYNALDTLVVENRRKQNDILKVRSNIYFILKPHTMDVLDIAVPPASISKFMDELDQVAKRHNMELPIFGHVGDGNLHPHIMMKKAGGVEREDLQKVKKEIYDLVVGSGGTISAEHGIGKLRTRDLNEYLGETSTELMRKIKGAFDPNTILNPGTIISSPQ